MPSFLSWTQFTRIWWIWSDWDDHWGVLLNDWNVFWFKFRILRGYKFLLAVLNSSLEGSDRSKLLLRGTISYFLSRILLTFHSVWQKQSIFQLFNPTRCVLFLGHLKHTHNMPTFAYFVKTFLEWLPFFSCKTPCRYYQKSVSMVTFQHRLPFPIENLDGIEKNIICNTEIGMYMCGTVIHTI